MALRPRRDRDDGPHRLMTRRSRRCGRRRARAARAARLGRRAPERQGNRDEGRPRRDRRRARPRLPRLGGGGEFDLAAYRGKVVVVNFWASWCVDCKLEAKTLRDAAARWRGKARRPRRSTRRISTFAAKRYMRHYDVNYGIVPRRGRLRRATAGASPATRRPSSSTRPGRSIPPHVNGPIPAAQLNAAIRQALRS